MRIQKKTRQHRRDFHAIYECEHCDVVTGEMDGYDDAYFHQNVIPNMTCTGCGKSSNGVATSAADVPAGLVL